MITRRDLLKGGSAGLAGVAALAAGLGSVMAALTRANNTGKHRWGMAIDLDRCTACGACAVACRQENNIPNFGPSDANQGAYTEWMSMYWQDTGKEGDLPEFLPLPCQHCADPPCVKVCPVGATYKGGDGITYQIWDRCIGCRYCMVACPYSRRSFNWQAPNWDDVSVQLLNPDVATRPVGVVEKCTFCHHRIKPALEKAKLDKREVSDEELQQLPACASACPARAIVFGDLNDPDAEVTRMSKNPRGYRLLEHLGTEPNVYYLKRDRSG